MKVALVVAAAGESTRLAGSEPKQFRPLSGIPLIEWTLRKAPLIDAVGIVVAVVPQGWAARLRGEIQGSLGKCGAVEIAVLTGGASRYESVRIGMEEAERRGFEAAVVHDAARPFATVDLFQRIVSELQSGAAAVAPALGVVDTIKLVDDDGAATLPRERLRRVQTPQGISIDTVLPAFDAAAEKGLAPEGPIDDVSMAELAGLRVSLVEGESLNFKITYEEDWAVAEAIVAEGLVQLPPATEDRLGPYPRRFARVPEGAFSGIGFDAHRLAEGIPLVLGGVTIPFPKGLRGHSDGDVVSHAVADALLGAARMGDIGTLYPSSDPKNRGRRSTEFLEEISGILREKGFLPHSVDVTVIAEEPKIAAYAEDIIRSLARALSIDAASISIKGTTTDGLGITGTGEGIAAVATAVVRSRPVGSHHPRHLA